MAVVKAFKGLYYNTEKIKLENVITQPYDKIDPVLQKEYLGRDPFNMVRLILKEPGQQDSQDNPYIKQAQMFEEWIQKGVFIRDREDTLYCYVQEFNLWGQKRRRLSFVGLGELRDYKEGEIFPHEETLSKPKADRLNHLKAMHTQFGLIFMLYEDSTREISGLLESAFSREPLMDFTDLDYKVRHLVWPIKEKDTVEAILRLMKSKKLLIADGHHRYETALNFRQEMKAQRTDGSAPQPYDFSMMAFVNLYDEGLEVLPTHRLVRNVSDDVLMNLTQTLRKEFRIERIELPLEQKGFFIQEKMKKIHADQHVIGLYYGSNDFMLLYYPEKFISKEKIERDHSDEWRGLDVVILHQMILKEILGIQEEAVKNESNIFYCREIEDALDLVNKGRAQLAFILNPVNPETVKNIAFRSERMPQKSTDFYPKLMTGLILNQMKF